LDASNSQELIDTLKQTAFKVKDSTVTDAQMTALMIVSQQYGLNPWVKEIYAYPDKGAIIPIVSVDGWSRIINDNPQFDGVEFVYSDETLEFKGHPVHEWIECKIYRKDRTRPTVIREYFDEVCRKINYPSPWDTHPKRMHRHKVFIQCSRVAFGFGGIYDQDEAEAIVSEKIINPNESSSIQDSLSIADKLLFAIQSMSIEDFKNVDPAPFSADEKITIRKAMSARKKQIETERTNNVIADVVSEPVDWELGIKESGDSDTLSSLLDEMPEAVQLEFGDLIDSKFDSFRVSA
jgi:phage recombination protein Bet